MILNLETKGIEYTNSRSDWEDTTDNIRVPLISGVATIAPPGFGAGLDGKAFPPSVFTSLYPQKGWAVGSYLLNPTPVEVGTGNSAYVVAGWQCTVAGRPGTWVELTTRTGTVSATTAELAAVGNAINTGAAKVEGYQVANETTGLTVIAAGNADNSVWVYMGTGNTAHTPV